MAREQFLFCVRVHDGQGNRHVSRRPISDEEIARIPTLRDQDRWAWQTGACWLEPWEDQEDVIIPDHGGFDPESWE